MKVKDSIVDVNNKLNSIFNFLNLFNSKFSSNNRLIDMFFSCFSFYLSNRKYAKTRKIYLHKLDKFIFKALIESKTDIIVSDTSIKNQVTIFIVYIYVYNLSIIKTIHHAINIISTEAELFTIRCRLNQATQLTDIEYIIIITDSIYIAKKIFNSSVYLYQI